jgi:hypothetical protein
MEMNDTINERFLIYIGRSSRGDGSKFIRKFYAEFNDDGNFSMITLTGNVPQHYTLLKGKEGAGFLRERGYKINRQYKTIEPLKRKAKK